MHNFITKLLKLLPAITGICLIAPLTSHAQNTLNPNYFYLVKGELIGRSISLGDPSNWSTMIQGREGQSAGEKIKVVAFETIER